MSTCCLTAGQIVVDLRVTMHVGEQVAMCVHVASHLVVEVCQFGEIGSTVDALQLALGLREPVVETVGMRVHTRHLLGEVLKTLAEGVHALVGVAAVHGVERACRWWQLVNGAGEAWSMLGLVIAQLALQLVALLDEWTQGGQLMDPRGQCVLERRAARVHHRGQEVADLSVLNAERSHLLQVAATGGNLRLEAVELATHASAERRQVIAGVGTRVVRHERVAFRARGVHERAAALEQRGQGREFGRLLLGLDVVIFSAVVDNVHDQWPRALLVQLEFVFVKLLAHLQIKHSL